MKMFTIGFTKKSAAQFFGSLRKAGVRRLVDVRLNNVSQLAGFTKRDDLRFFAKEVCGIEYVHMLNLAPTQGMLDDYKKHGGSWDTYEAQFRALLQQRAIERTVSRDDLDGACLLCSEEKPHHCHRRLVAEYLQASWSGLAVAHL